ncbi:MAG: beta-galactosidase [Chloroflexota bacterium]
MLNTARHNLTTNVRLLWWLLRRYGDWAVRVLVIALVLVRLQPAEPRAALGEPQTVITEKPHLCVHTRLIDEVETWKIQKSLQLVREMGADHIVEFFPWAYIENERGVYNWQLVDRIVSHAENQGIRVIARTGFVPWWARADIEQSTLNTLSEDAYPDFANFVAAFAERYAGTADEIIIWNEPNLAFEWGYTGVDPAGYARLLEAVYDRAHAANPDVMILFAGLAPTLEPPGSANALDDILFLEAAYEAGAGNYFDGMTLHTYGFTHPAEMPPAPDALNFRRAELLYDVMARYGDADKPVYITETGWNDHPQWALAVRPSERAIYTIDGLHIAEDWPWLDQMCLWMLRTPAPINSHQDGYTMMTPEFQLKAIYYAVQNYALGRERDSALWLPPPSEQ